jgi:hypothetical protein
LSGALRGELLASLEPDRQAVEEALNRLLNRGPRKTKELD